MRVVKVGVVDSGINRRHRQIGRVAGGVGVRIRDGEVLLDDDWADGIGHGTAVAATILAHAPDAELYSIRIFHRRLETRADALSRALEWAHEHELDLVNLSLGCRERAPSVVGVPVIVAPAEEDYPGSIAVRDDRDLDIDQLVYRDGAFIASPWARTLDELPKERNFHGTSLAVAHVTGFAARALGAGVPPNELQSALRDGCEKIET